MNTWTKEPWKRDGYDIWHFGSGYEREAGDQPDPHRFTGITLHEKLRESPVAIACMDRIVACVNACARIPDPAAIAELRKVCQQLADAFPHDDFDKYDAADFKDNAGVILDAAINARAALSKLPNHKGE